MRTCARRRQSACATFVVLMMPFTAIMYGCGSYYKVTDPASGKVYYTSDVDQERSGHVEFKDARTKAKVTLNSSEVQKIDKSEYKAAVDGAK